MSALRLCVWTVTWLLAGPVLAQAPRPLSVTRGPGADDCPDAPGLLARIEEIRKNPPRADQPPYEVTFARDGNGVYSQITSAQTGAERVLTDASLDCAALAQATAVTLALLFDADAHALEQPTPPASPPPLEQPPPQAQPAAPPARDPAEQHRLIVSFGPAALAGVNAPVALAVPGELGYAYGSWRAAIGVLYAFAMPHELGSGSVLQSVGAGSLLGCFAPWRDQLWRLDVCASVLAGAARGTARGFGDNRSRTRGWLAPAVEARFGRLPDRFGAELGVAILWPVTRRDFAVDGAGVAYESSPVAALVSLRGSFSIFPTER